MQSAEVLSPVSVDLQPKKTEKSIEQIHQNTIQPSGRLFLSKIRLSGYQALRAAGTHSQWRRLARITSPDARTLGICEGRLLLLPR